MVKVNVTEKSLPQPSKGGAVRITIQVTSHTFRPGEKVTGQLHISENAVSNPRPVQLEFVGTEYCRWTETVTINRDREGSQGGSDRLSLTKSASNEIRRERIDLVQSPGKKVVPFRLTLPKKLPASGVIDEESIKGGVIYHLIAHFPDEETPVLCPKCDLAIMPLSESLPKSVDETREVLSCCCISSGSITSKLTVDHCEFFVGETLSVSARVNGIYCSSAIRQVTGKLIQKIYMRDKGTCVFVRERTISEEAVVTQNVPTDVVAYNFSLQTIDGESEECVCPSVKATCFSCTYVVAVESQIDSIPQTVLSLRLPIVLLQDVLKVEQMPIEELSEADEGDDEEEEEGIPMDQRAEALFCVSDAHSSGVLTTEKLKEALGVLGQEYCLRIPDDKSLDSLIATLDTDGDGKITLPEFQELIEKISQRFPYDFV